MNFKPSVTKVIVSIIFGMGLGFYLSWQQTISFGWAFHLNVFKVLSPIIIILCYVIWSLIQKKK
jgi:hypothetical protein